MSSTENRWKSIGGINRTNKNYIVRTPEMTTKNNKITNVSGLVNSTMEQKSTINLSDSARIKYTDENTIYNTNIAYYPFNNLSSLSNADSIENECNNTNVTTSNFNLYLGLSDNLSSSSADYSNNIYVVDDETYGSCIEFRNKSYTMYTENALNTTNIYGDSNADNYKLSYGLSINCWVKPTSLDSSFCLFAIDTLNQDYLNTTDINTDDISKNTLYFWWPGETSGKGQILLTNDNDISVNNYHGDDVIIANDNSFGNVQENVWQMITLQIDGNKIELYVNGVKEASINNILVGTPIPDAPILINAGPLRWSETDGSYNSNITNYESDSSTGLRMLDFNVDNGAFSSTLLIDKYEAGPNNKFDFAYLISENGLHVTKDSNFTSNMNVGGVFNTHGSLNAFGLSSLYDDTYIYGDLYVEGDFIVNDDVTFANANFYSMNISGNLVTVGTSTLKDSTTLNDTLTVSGISTFNSSVYINDTLDVTGNTTISNNMSVTGTSSLSTLTVSGTSTISSILTVNGAAILTNRMDVTDDVSMNSNLDVNNNASVGGTLDVTGETTLSSNVDIVGAATLSNSVDIVGAATLYSRMDVSGDVSMNSNLDVNGDVAIDGSLNVSGYTTLNGLLVGDSVTMESTLDITGTTNINNNLTTSSLIVTNDTSMNSNAYISGNLNVDSSVNIVGNLDLSGTATLEHLTVVGNVLFEDISLSTVNCDSLNTDALIVTADSTIDGTLNVGNLTVIDTFTITNDLSLDKINVTEIDADKIGIGTTASSTYALDVDGSTYISGNLTVNGYTSITSDSGFTIETGNLIVSDGTGYISKSLTVGTTFNVAGDVSMNSDLTVGGNLTVTGSADINITYDSGLTITSGDLSIDDGKIYIGTGSSQVSLYSEEFSSTYYVSTTHFYGKNILASSLIVDDGDISVLEGSITVSELSGAGGDITADGTISASSFSASSDMNLKDNIMPIENSLMTIEQLQGKTFTWKKDDKKTKHYGVIAQELESVLPELVTTNNNTNQKSVNYMEIIGLLIESVKELSEKVKSLEKIA